MRYSIEPRNTMHIKGYGFLYFAKNIGKNLNNKYSQKLLDNAKKSTAYAIKNASKRAIQNTAETTGDLIDGKVADKITGISGISVLRKVTYLQKKDRKLLMN